MLLSKLRSLTRSPRPQTEPATVVAAIPVSASPMPYLRRGSRFVISPLTLTLDQLLFLIVATLLCFGMIMVQSADLRVRGVTEHWILQSFNNKNFVHAMAAIGLMTILWRMDYQKLLGRTLLRSPAFWFMAVTVLSLAAVLVAGSTLNGAKRWLMIPLGVTKLSVQPSELAKWAMVVFLAAYATHAQESIRKVGVSLVPVFLIVIGAAALAAMVLLRPEHIAAIGEKVHFFGGADGATKLRAVAIGVGVSSMGAAYLLHRRPAFRTWVWGFLPMITVVGLVAALIVKEDFGTTALIAMVALTLILMTNVRMLHIGPVIPLAMGVGYLFVRLSPYRWTRITSFLHPEQDPQGTGYHALQSLLAVASGGFWGRGLGNGIQKMGFLPEGNTDFVFSVLCEELGFFGAGLVILLFIVFVIVGWRIASRCQNHFGKMIALGITATVGLQAAINIAVVTVTVPTKGIALPFISSGGTGWILTAGAVGLLMAIERQNRLAASAREIDRLASTGFPVHLGGEVATSPAEQAALLEPATISPPVAQPIMVAATPTDAVNVEAIAVEPEPVAAIVAEPEPTAPTVVEVSASPQEQPAAAPAAPAAMLEGGPIIMVAALPTVATPSEPEPKPITRWPSAASAMEENGNVEERPQGPQTGQESAG